MPRSVRRSIFTGSSTPGGYSVIVPLGVSAGGSSFMIASAVVVLPQPDSPASPSASPGSIVRSTPATIGMPAVVDLQTLDLEQAHAGASCSRGLMCCSKT